MSIPPMLDYNQITIKTMLEELKTKTPLTRDDIAALLASIGAPGEKQDEKTAAVTELAKINSQGIGLEQTLHSYGEF